ncbi:hypothetical protein ACFT0G_29000 [Streptomyces sp. NPDC057020]|uniref:hypothetical protein n=1 Tax=unclassified Streptomyces TaxID=2593676 RepID=UPI003635256D
MDNEKRMTTWCRTWNEDPSLAHDLMSDDCVQWSDRVADLDSVVGPDDQERFVTAYRARHVNIFSPRVLVDAGDRFAYLWDVEKADGRTLTGIDVSILTDDRIQEDWTFVAQGAASRQIRNPARPTGPTWPRSRTCAATGSSSPTAGSNWPQTSRQTTFASSLAPHQLTTPTAPPSWPA